MNMYRCVMLDEYTNGYFKLLMEGDSVIHVHMLLMHRFPAPVYCVIEINLIEEVIYEN